MEVSVALVQVYIMIIQQISILWHLKDHSFHHFQIGTIILDRVFGRDILNMKKQAMDIGKYVYDYQLSKQVLFAGHSLGGGLASAATFFAALNDDGIIAYTFNAARFMKGTGINYTLNEPSFH